MVIDTTDVRSNANKQIKHAVTTIGRSEDRFKVFQEIYRGKSNGKTAAQIAEKINMEEMRVLQEALVLSKAKIIGKTKINGRLVYTKDEFISLNKEKIIRLVLNSTAFEKFQTEIGDAKSTDDSKIVIKKVIQLTGKKVKKIKILFLAANPEDTDRLRQDKEFREIEHKILLAPEKDRFLLINKGAVRTSDIQLYLNQYKPEIVHITGHGSSAKQIVLENVSGTSVEVPVEALEGVFKTLKDNVRCVVLNTCFSSEQAKAISKYIDFVIGTTDSIYDDSGTAFSYGFYLALASGRSIQNAFEQGLNEILLSGTPSDKKKIILLCRENVDPSKNFFL